MKKAMKHLVLVALLATQATAAQAADDFNSMNEALKPYYGRFVKCETSSFEKCDNSAVLVISIGARDRVFGLMYSDYRNNKLESDAIYAVTGGPWKLWEDKPVAEIDESGKTWKGRYQEWSRGTVGETVEYEYRSQTELRRGFQKKTKTHSFVSSLRKVKDSKNLVLHFSRNGVKDTAYLRSLGTDENPNDPL